MSTTLTIGGTAVSLPRDVIPGRLIPFVKGGCPSFSFMARGGPLPVLPDPYLGKAVSLSINGTVRFVGDVASVHTDYAGLGWVRQYQCTGLRDRGDWIPHTDSATTTDQSGYNLQPEDPAYNPGRAGRTVGQIVADVLTMAANASGLSGWGVGNYTFPSGVPTLPATTLADLAAFTIIPPGPVYVSGQRLLGAIEGFLSQWEPNAVMWVDPSTGDVRFLDLRSFASNTLTLGTDPIRPTPLSRDLTQAFQRVIVRGAPVATMAALTLSGGTLLEDFAHDGLTNAAAKAAWVATDFTNPSTQQDQGTCTCPTTTTVTVTSSSASRNWISDYWDQTSTGAHGTINLYDTTVTGVTAWWTARIVANTALTAGGTSTLTIDAPLPGLTFDRYTINGLAGGASQVWRHYQIADSTIWPAVTQQSTYPQAFINSGGGAATLTSSPMGAILYSTSGSPPYTMFPLPFTFDTSGNIFFTAPTFVIAGNQAPNDVWVYIPVNREANEAIYPADVAGVPQFSGTSNSVEGLERTLTVTVPAWRDPAQFTSMLQYAQDLHDSVADTIVEGTVEYLGLYEPALTMGQALTIDASGYTVPYGWDGLSIPIIETEMEWSTSMQHVTRMRLSSRRAANSAETFLHPARTGLTWSAGSGEAWSPVAGLARQNQAMLGGGAGYQAFQGQFQAANRDDEASTIDPIGDSMAAMGGGDSGGSGFGLAGGMGFDGPGNNMRLSKASRARRARMTKPDRIGSPPAKKPPKPNYIGAQPTRRQNQREKTRLRKQSVRDRAQQKDIDKSWGPGIDTGRMVNGDRDAPAPWINNQEFGSEHFDDSNGDN